MNRKSTGIAGLVALFAIGMITASGSLSEVSGDSTKKPSAPRYSEICAHGHNGFACDPPQYKIDISDLQKKTSELEKRVSLLEQTR